MKKPQATGGGVGASSGSVWGEPVMGREPITKALYAPTVFLLQRLAFFPRGPLSPHSCHASPFFWLRDSREDFSGERKAWEARHFGRAFFLSVASKPEISFAALPDNRGVGHGGRPFALCYSGVDPAASF